MRPEKPDCRPSLLRVKPVAVIPVFDLPEVRFVRKLLPGFRCGNPFGKVGFKLPLRVPEHGCVIRIHRNVGQVVEIGKQRNVAEFRDPCHKDEMLLLFTGFDGGIKSLQYDSISFSSGFPILFRIGLSYSSTRMTTGASFDTAEINAPKEDANSSFCI